MKELIASLYEEKILYLVALLCLAMFIDCFSGIVAAKMNHTFTSKIGINGILRKIWSLVLLLFFLPVSMIIPLHAGLGLVYFFYLGYLFMEIHSILENYQKMGVDNERFRQFVQLLQAYLKKYK